MTTTVEQAIGAPVARIEGVAKVSGQARYAAEYPLPGLAYGSVAASRIARGRVRRIDATAVLAMPGVLVSAILTFINSWGAFLIPLVLDSNPGQTPAAVGIYQFLDANAQVQYGPLAAYSILFSIPVLVLYLISSRWLQGGFAFAGGIKG